MKTELTLLGNDLKSFYSGAKNVFRGAFEGVYTPLILQTSFREILENAQGEDASAGYAIGRVVVAADILAFGAVYATWNDRGLEAASILLATNLVDYALNLHKRADESKSSLEKLVSK